MTTYSATGHIEAVVWESTDGLPRGAQPAVALKVAIPAADFTGLDINRPITITQEEA